jgi:tetratricopeptide (TPR) repeat protein
MDRTQQAASAYIGDLSNALLHNLDASAEILSLLRPFFSADWVTPSAELDDVAVRYLANQAAWALHDLDQLDQALILYGTSVRCDLKMNDQRHLPAPLHNASLALEAQNRLRRSDAVGRLSHAFAELNHDPAPLFAVRVHRFHQLVLRGEWAEAEVMWQTLDPMGRDWPRYVYRAGKAELAYAAFCFVQGTLTADLLDEVERLARLGRNRVTLRELYSLRGEWLMESGDWAAATDASAKAIRMAHEGGRTDTGTETQLALARFHLGKLHDPRQEAIRLASLRRPDHLTVVELWHAIGESDQAVKHALAAYQWAWADGHPYVRGHLLKRATSLLNILGAKTPELPAYDPRRDLKLPWEAEVAAALYMRRPK